jgi:hypothetical protein
MQPTLPKPLNYAFPAFIPGRFRIPPDFQLWPDAFFPDLKSGSLPQTPPIPPTVATGDVITSGHENTVSTAINDLWINEQWLAANTITDPTTATGDIVVRGPSGIAALPAGANGTVLVADSTQTNGLKWVSSSVVAPVTSVFGRTGAVVLTSADLASTDAVRTSGMYANPPWITSLNWSVLTGVPATFPPSPHTHAASDIVSGVLATARLGTGTQDSTTFLRGDGLWAVPPTGGGGGGTPAGAAGDVQLNNGAGAFAASSLLHWDTTNSRLGVGTSTPPARLTVSLNAAALQPPTSDTVALVSNADGTATRLMLDCYGASAVLTFRTAGGTAAAPTAVASGQALGFVTGQGRGATMYGAGARVGMNFYSAEAWTDSAQGAYMSFYTTPAGSTTIAERMRIDPSGNVGIGTTSPGYKLDVSGQIRSTSAGGNFIYPADSGYEWWVGSYTDLVSFQVTHRQIAGPNSYIAPLTITTGGNVGVGTASPLATVHSTGSIFVSGLGSYPTNSGAGLLFYWNNSTGYVQSYDYVAAALKPLYLQGNPVVLIPPGSSGNVGIGTASPYTLLQLTSTSHTGAATITYHGTEAMMSVDVPGNAELATGWLGASPYTWWLQSRNGNALPLALNPAGGNVGIGTSSPQYPLTVISPANPGSVAGLAGLTVGSSSNYLMWLGFGNPGIGVNIGAIQVINGSPSTYGTLTLQPSGGNVGIGMTNPSGILHLNGGGGSNSYAYLALNCSGTLPAALGTGGAISWNYTNSGGEVDFFNLYTSAGQYFNFYQMTSASVATRVMQIAPGGVTIAGSVNITGQYQVNGVPLATGGITTQSFPGYALNTVYQNTTGKPKMVCVSAGVGMTVNTDASNPPGAVVLTVSAVAGGQALAVFWVLPGNFYKVNSSGALSNWTEWY